MKVKAENTRSALARSCRAYLVNIERKGSSGAWESTTFGGSEQLAWDGPRNDPYPAVDLPRGVPLFIIVLKTEQGSMEFSPEVEQPLAVYQSFMRTTGTYRFTIVVPGDGAKPATIVLSFEWNGTWDQFKVEKVD